MYDEVQTGFGRTAEWFAADHYDAKPDIIAMGKGIANGLPLSSYGASREIIDAWPAGSHGTTYGGNPVAAAAAAAVIDTMGELLPGDRELSKRAFERFGELAERHATIGDVRGLGLMIGIELVEDRDSRVPDAEAFKHVKAPCHRAGADHHLMRARRERDPLHPGADHHPRRARLGDRPAGRWSHQLGALREVIR